MAGRTVAEAVDAFFHPQQRIVSCVTRATLIGRVYRDPAIPTMMTIDRGVQRLGRFGALGLGLRHWYVVERLADTGWSVRTTGYGYTLLHGMELEFIACHWHPAARRAVTYPHLHVGGVTLPVNLSKAHLATGHVTLAAVVRMAIAELGVEPLRRDWQDVLRAEETRVTS